MRGLSRSFVVLAVAVAAALSPGSPAGGPLFSVNVPREMVTGRVEVTAVASDGNVRAVKWTVDDWSRVTPPPFTLSFDAGPVPYERRVLAVALDKDRRPLYRKEAILNPGGRGLALEFHRPVEGERASGRVLVELHVTTPSDDQVASLSLEAGGTEVPLSPAGPGILQGVVDVPPVAVPLVARLSTQRGRQTERTLVVNAPGAVASSSSSSASRVGGSRSRASARATSRSATAGVPARSATRGCSLTPRSPSASRSTRRPPSTTPQSSAGRQPTSSWRAASPRRTRPSSSRSDRS
jgi:hypothetical protein